jgi:hypothetical protein
MQQDLHLGDMLKARLAGQPVTQVPLDLRHICPLSGMALIATNQTSRAFYLFENRSEDDRSSMEWRKYLANIRRHNMRTAGY